MPMKETVVPQQEKNRLELKLKKNIFLVIPPNGLFLRDDRCQSEAWTVARPPMGLAYAAAFLEQDGHKCVIHDYPAEKRSWEEFERDLLHTQPDAIFVNFTMPTLEQDVKAFKLAKKINPHILTIAKGADLYINDVRILEACPELDIGIRKEVDFTIQEIFRNLDTLHEVQGITFRDSSGKIVQTPDKGYEVDLDSFPFPARHLLNNDLYLRPDTHKKLGIVYTARGCPALCTFCAVPLVSGRQLRRRSVENVIAEINQCQNDLDIHDFFFFADTFTIDKRWVMKFCKEIIERKLNIKWACNSRPDSIDLEMAIMMKKSGCDVVSFGVETGSDRLLKSVKKGSTTADCENAVEICRKAGLKSMAFLIIGLPGETRDDALQTISFSKKLNPDFIEYNVAYTFPGSDMALELERKGFPQRKSDILKYESKSLSEHMTLDEINQLLNKAIFKFHFRPAYILKILGGARSPMEILNYVKHGIWRFSTFFSRK